VKRPVTQNADSADGHYYSEGDDPKICFALYREFSLVATKILPWNILYLPGRTYLSQLVL